MTPPASEPESVQRAPGSRVTLRGTIWWGKYAGMHSALNPTPRKLISLRGTTPLFLASAHARPWRQLGAAGPGAFPQLARSPHEGLPVTRSLEPQASQLSHTPSTGSPLPSSAFGGPGCTSWHLLICPQAIGPGATRAVRPGWTQQQPGRWGREALGTSGDDWGS